MRKVTAFIQPFRLDRTLEALRKVGVAGMTLSEARGCGRQKGAREVYRGAEYTVELLPKLELEVVVPDGAVMDVMRAIAHAARTGRIGDGKLLLSPVEDAIRIRTGERGDAALS